MFEEKEDRYLTHLREYLDTVKQTAAIYQKKIKLQQALSADGETIHYELARNYQGSIIAGLVLQDVIDLYVQSKLANGDKFYSQRVKPTFSPIALTQF